MSLGDELRKSLREARIKALADKADEHGKMMAGHHRMEDALSLIILALRELEKCFEVGSGIRFYFIGSFISIKLTKPKRLDSLWEILIDADDPKLREGRPVQFYLTVKDLLEPDRYDRFIFQPGSEEDLVRAVIALIAAYETRGYIAKADEILAGFLKPK